MRKPEIWGGRKPRSYGIGFAFEVQTDWGLELWATVSVLSFFASVRWDVWQVRSPEGES